MVISSEGSKNSRLKNGASRLLLGFGSVIIIICALIVLGVYVPSLPYIGALGTIAFSLLMPWFALFTALAAVLSGWRWLAQRGNIALVLCIIAILSTAGAASAFVRSVNYANANGITVNLAQTFGFTSTAGGGAPNATVVYTAYQGTPLHLDIFRPDSPLSTAKTPVLLYVHGGGWNMGSRTDHAKDMRWFANHGWLVISMDYTLSDAHHALWNVTTPQVGCAMTWIAAHAADYNGDSSRLAMVGDSAGGNLVLNASYMANSGALVSSCGGTIPKVKAVIATYPVVDLARAYTNPDPLLGPVGRMISVDYMGGTPNAFPGRYATARSANYISTVAPSTLIIVGESDHLVPPQATYDFVRQAKAAGVPVALIRIPYGEHGFDIIQGRVGNQIFRHATIKFLDQNN